MIKLRKMQREIIAEKDISFLVIINEGKPQGVLSESDFVRKIAAEDKKASEDLRFQRLCHTSFVQ